MSNRSVFNYYSQKYFKENPDSIPEKGMRKNFSGGSKRRNFDGEDDVITKMAKALAKEYVALKYQNKADVNPELKQKLMDKEVESQQIMGLCTTAAKAIYEEHKDEIGSNSEKGVEIGLAQLRDEYKSRKQGSEQKLAMKGFSRRNYAEPAQDKAAEKEAIKTANKAGAVKNVCGSANKECLAKAEGAAMSAKIHGSDDAIKNAAKKFLNGQKLTSDEEKQLFGKIFPKNFAHRATVRNFADSYTVKIAPTLHNFRSDMNRFLKTGRVPIMRNTNNRLLQYLFAWLANCIKNGCTEFPDHIIVVRQDIKDIPIKSFQDLCVILHKIFTVGLSPEQTNRKNALVEHYIEKPMKNSTPGSLSGFEKILQICALKGNKTLTYTE